MNFMQRALHSFRLAASIWTKEPTGPDRDDRLQGTAPADICRGVRESNYQPSHGRGGVLSKASSLGLLGCKKPLLALDDLIEPRVR